MATFAPSLQFAKDRFGKDAINPTEHWSSLVENFPEFNNCLIYHRMDVPHKDFLDYTAYLSAFEMVVCHPDRGVVVVIDRHHRERTGLSVEANNDFYKDIQNKFVLEWQDIPFEYCFVDNMTSQIFLETVIEKLKKLPINYKLMPNHKEVVRYLNDRLGLMALPPGNLSEFENYLDTRFIRISEKASLFERINEVCAVRSKNTLPLRLAIDGTAGCGKTLGALHLYKQLSNQGARPLLLCFNHLLGRWLDQECSGTRGFANTVYNFAQKMLKVHGREPADPAADHLKKLLALLESGEFVDDDEKFDVLIVDEGQDFQEYWVTVIKYFLRDNYEVVWFQDGRQNILSRENRIDLIQHFPGISLLKRINENLRSPTLIIRHGINLLERICSATGCKNPGDLDNLSTSNMKGISPRNHSYIDKEDLVKKVEKRVKELLDQGLKKSQINIISCRNTDSVIKEKRESSPFLNFKPVLVNEERVYLQEKLGEYELRRFTGKYNNNGNKIYRPEKPGDGIFCIDIFKKKGLEAPSIILVDIERPNDLPYDQWLQRLYCGITRATYSLDVYYRKECWDQNEKTFNFELA